MQDKTRSIMFLILLVGIPLVAVLAIAAFVSKDFRVGAYPALVVSVVMVLTVGIFKKFRLLQFLTYDVVAYALWDLVFYHSRLRPHHILLVSAIGVPVGLMLAMLIYRLWKNHMKDGIIVYEESRRKFFIQIIQILLVEAGILVFFLLPIFNWALAIFFDLLWLLASAVITCLLYLTVGILLLERRTGQRIRHAYSDKQMPWSLLFTSVSSMAILMGLIEIFRASIK